MYFLVIQSYSSSLKCNKLILLNHTVKNRTYLGSSALHPVPCGTTEAVNMLKAGPLLHNLNKYSKQSRMLQGLTNTCNRIFENTYFSSFSWLLVGGLRQCISLMYHGQSRLRVMFLQCMVWLFFFTSRLERVYNNKSSWKPKAAVCWLSCCQPAEIFLVTEPWQVLTAFAESSKEISNVNVSSSINAVWDSLVFLVYG